MRVHRNGCRIPKVLAAAMSGVMCQAGHTQIRRVLAHARKENAREEGRRFDSGLATPAKKRQRISTRGERTRRASLMLPRRRRRTGRRNLSEIAHLTGGAFCQFDDGAADRLADLLKAAAAFAVGGAKALATQNSEAARLLLTQIKK